MVLAGRRDENKALRESYDWLVHENERLRAVIAEYQAKERSQ